MGNVGSSTINKHVEKNKANLVVSGRYHANKKADTDYIIENVALGTGYGWEVQKAKGKYDGCRYVVKTFRKRMTNRKRKRQMKEEAIIFLEMDHPHIARLLGVYETAEDVALVVEYVAGGQVMDRIIEQGMYTEKEAAETIYQILQAVNYLHKHGVMHRDLTLQNFLYESKNSKHLKLIDFGLSKLWNFTSPKMDSAVGNLQYTAPEVIKCAESTVINDPNAMDMDEKGYTTKCDLWSVGVMLFMLLSGKMPFQDKHGRSGGISLTIQAGVYNMQGIEWSSVSADGKDLIEKLLVLDPNKRLDARAAMEHEWITSRATHSAVLSRGITKSLSQFAAASRFKKICLSMVSWSLSTEVTEDIREVFLELDKEKTGMVTLGQLREALETQCTLGEDEVRSIVTSFSQLERDEEIHYSDFLGAMIQSRIQLNDETIWATFRRFDVDGSGYITAQDLKTVLGATLSAADADAMITEMSNVADTRAWTESTGRKEGYVSYANFLSYVTEGNATDRSLTLTATFLNSTLLQTERLGSDSPDAYQQWARREGRMRTSPGCIQKGRALRLSVESKLIAGAEKKELSQGRHGSAPAILGIRENGENGSDAAQLEGVAGQEGEGLPIEVSNWHSRQLLEENVQVEEDPQGDDHITSAIEVPTDSGPGQGVMATLLCCATPCSSLAQHSNDEGGMAQKRRS